MEFLHRKKSYIAIEFYAFWSPMRVLNVMRVEVHFLTLLETYKNDDRKMIFRRKRKLHYTYYIVDSQLFCAA
jgi:hypothetical protein